MPWKQILKPLLGFSRLTLKSEGSRNAVAQGASLLKPAWTELALRRPPLAVTRDPGAGRAHRPSRHQVLSPRPVQR